MDLISIALSRCVYMANHAYVNQCDEMRLPQ